MSFKVEANKPMRNLTGYVDSRMSQFTMYRLKPSRMLHR